MRLCLGEMVGEVLEGKGDSGECLAKVEVLPLGDEDSEERDRVVNAIWLPKVRECSDTDLLRKELLEDDTLAKLRSLGNQRARGYHWEEGIWYHRTSDFDEGVVDRIVLPKCRHKKVLQIAHEGTGHLSTKKVRDILHSRFTWPYIARDIDSHCRSCETCQRSSKRGERKALMVERPVISEPFEYVAVDLVGPFPRSKNGSKCMASRWPDAVAVKSITASTVARGLVQIFSRTGDFGMEKNILDDIKCEGIDETELCELLSEFDDVLIPTPGSCTIGEVDVVIEEGVTPISQAPYKIPHKIREGVKRNWNHCWLMG